MEGHPYVADLVCGSVVDYRLLGAMRKQVVVGAVGVALHLCQHVGFGHVVGGGYHAVDAGLCAVCGGDVELGVAQVEVSSVGGIGCQGVEAVGVGGEVPVAQELSVYLVVLPVGSDGAVPGGAGGEVLHLVLWHHGLLLWDSVVLVAGYHESGGEWLGRTCARRLHLTFSYDGEAHGVGASADVLHALKSGLGGTCRQDCRHYNI